MKPILFNTEMVRALLANRKSVTRRVVKPHYRNGEAGFHVITNKHTGQYVRIEIFDEWEDEARWMNEPYRPGDILYVRETWCENGNYELYPFETEQFWYKADRQDRDLPTPEWFRGWRPSIHMPREAARLFLRATDVWVERLQDITEDGTMQEGIQHTDFGTYLPNWKMSIDGGKTFHHPKEEIHYPGYHVGQVDGPDQCYPTARGAYHALWDSILKPADRPLYGWDANPWVWVIEFERISKEDIPPAELAR